MAERAKRVILIVGMHRSGTSALARVVNLLGAELPGELVPGSVGNETGHWEPEAIVRLHDAMLAEAGSNVNAVIDFDSAWLESAAAERMQAEIEAFFREAASPLIALKDPRTSLFLPIWRRAAERIGAQLSVVICFRPPAEAAQSLRKRQASYFPDSPWPDARGLLVWLRYSLAAERDSRGLPRAFVSFDALLDDWRGETARIARQLGHPWPVTTEAAAPAIDGFLSRERRHESDLPLTSDSSWPAHVHAALQASVANPDALQETFDLASAALADAGRLYGAYVQDLETLIGGLSGLKTEYRDLPSVAEARSRREAARASLLAGAVVDTPELHALAGEADRRVLLARIAELEAFERALVSARLAQQAKHQMALEGALNTIARLERESAARGPDRSAEVEELQRALSSAEHGWAADVALLREQLATADARARAEAAAETDALRQALEGARAESEALAAERDAIAASPPALRAALSHRLRLAASRLRARAR